MSTQNSYSYAPYQLYEAENSPSMRLVLMCYVRRWKWFVLSVLLAGIGAYAYLQFHV